MSTNSTGPQPGPRRPAATRTSTATRVLLVLTVLGLVAFAATIAVTVWLVSRFERNEIAEGSFLEVDLSGQIGDAPEVNGLVFDPDKVPETPTNIARAIRKAATDDRIKGVYVKLDGPAGGWAVYQEIRGALSDFRASKKPCVVYSEAYMTGDYYLASVCDKVVLAPSGITAVSGIETNITYYAGTLEKLGIQPEFEHVGDFKSAIEPFMRTEPSDGAKVAYEGLLDGLWETFIADVSKSRGLAPEQVSALIDVPPMSPKEALNAHLVDALAYPDALEDHLADIGDADWAKKMDTLPTKEELDKKRDEKDDDKRFTPVRKYIKDILKEDDGKDDKIAVIYAEGTIVSGDGGGGLFGGGGGTLADGPFAEWVEEARDDESVKAVVLRVNSPGGSGLASDNMLREVRLLQAAGKPVVVSMANYAASGGYFISCDADWIVAQPSTLTGSIGVFGGKMNLAGTYEKLGMTQYEFKKGENADLFSLTRPFSDDGRTVFRKFLQDFYDDFVNKVAGGRHKTYDEVHAIAQGRVWTGNQAKANGLVDEVGGLDVALKKAAELGKLSDYGVTSLPRQKGFYEVLMEDLEKNSNAKVQIDVPMVDAAVGDASKLIVLEKVLSDNGVAAYEPVDVTF
jgi:protease-4